MSAEKPMSVKLRVAMYPKDEYWVAHCLELDLLTAAQTQDEAWEDIQAICETQITFALEHDACDSLFRPPSAELLKMVSCGDDEDEVVIHLDGDGHPSRQRTLRLRKVVPA